MSWQVPRTVVRQSRCTRLRRASARVLRDRPGGTLGSIPSPSSPSGQVWGAEDGPSSRRLLGMGLPGLAGHRLPRRPCRVPMVRPLRPVVRHGRAEQHVLPAAVGVDRRTVGGAGTVGLLLRREGGPVRIAPNEARRRRTLARATPRTSRRTRRPPRTEPRPTSTALAAQHGSARRVPLRRPAANSLGDRVPGSLVAARRHVRGARQARGGAVHPRSHRLTPVATDDELDLRAIPRADRHGRPVSGTLWTSPSCAPLLSGCWTGWRQATTSSPISTTTTTVTPSSMRETLRELMSVSCRRIRPMIDRERCRECRSTLRPGPPSRSFLNPETCRVLASAAERLHRVSAVSRCDADRVRRWSLDGAADPRR